MTAEARQHGPIERLLERLCDISAAVGGIVVVGIAFMTVTSVIGRAFFHSPILGDIELVQLGSAVVVASFLPYTQFRRANIIVDFFTTGMAARKQLLLDAAGTLLYSLVLIVILWRVAIGGIVMYGTNESSMLMGLPLWIPYMLMLPGLALCVAIGFYQAFRQFRDAARMPA